MDQVEKLLELYRQTQTPSERRFLFETVRISSPQEFVRLEERILREHVRAMTTERLIQTIAGHRGLALQQAEELLRDTVFQHLLDRSKLVAFLSPVSEPASTVTPTQTAPQTSKLNESDRRSIEVAILKDQGDPSPRTAEKISEALDEPTSAATPLPRLTPRGIGG